MKKLWRGLVPGTEFTTVCFLFCWVFDILGGHFGWAAFYFVLWALNAYSHDMQRRGYHG